MCIMQRTIATNGTILFNIFGKGKYLSLHYSTKTYWMLVTNTKSHSCRPFLLFHGGGVDVETADSNTETV